MYFCSQILTLLYKLNDEEDDIPMVGAVADGAGEAIVTVKEFDPVNAPKAAVTVNVYAPATVGVPVIVPEVLSVNPGGSVPVYDHVAGSSAPVSSALSISV